jgi:biopolymer transport protein ExbD
MAGGGEGLGGGAKPKRGGGARKVKKRVGFRLDMTPLVDITFLLLTFFMLTTTMTTPQTMRLGIPPEIDKPVEVAASKLMTIKVRNDGKIFYGMGQDVPSAISIKELRGVVIKQNVALKNDCIVTLKADKNASYGMFIAALDEINQAESEIINGLRGLGINKRERKFVVAPLDDKDIEEIKAL